MFGRVLKESKEGHMGWDDDLEDVLEENYLRVFGDISPLEEELEIGRFRHQTMMEQLEEQLADPTITKEDAKRLQEDMANAEESFRTWSSAKLEEIHASYAVEEDL